MYFSSKNWVTKNSDENVTVYYFELSVVNRVIRHTTILKISVKKKEDKIGGKERGDGQDGRLASARSVSRRNSSSRTAGHNACTRVHAARCGAALCNASTSANDGAIHVCVVRHRRAAPWTDVTAFPPCVCCVCTCVYMPARFLLPSPSALPFSSPWYSQYLSRLPAFSRIRTFSS